MGGRRRRSFTQDYKQQAVELVFSSGRSVTSQRRSGYPLRLLRRWADKLAGGPGGGRLPVRSGRMIGCVWNVTFRKKSRSRSLPEREHVLALPPASADPHRIRNSEEFFDGVVATTPSPVG